MLPTQDLGADADKNKPAELPSCIFSTPNPKPYINPKPSQSYGVLEMRTLGVWERLRKGPSTYNNITALTSVLESRSFREQMLPELLGGFQALPA